jgi:hypothetical protein
LFLQSTRWNLLLPKRALFPVAPGETVTAWALGALEEMYFPGEVKRHPDTVDYVFANGFVDVGDLPCRVATWDDVAKRPQPQLADFETVGLNLPGAGRKLDFSGFWHRPHRLRRWAKTWLVPPDAQPAPFSVKTCGGVQIWVDGQHVHAFEPFQRNAPASIDITLPLRPTGSEVVLLIEEMAERDTSYFVELTWRGNSSLVSELETDADPEVLQALRKLAAGIRPLHTSFDGTAPLTLLIDAPAVVDVTIDARVGQSVHLSHKPPLFVAQAVLRAGARSVDLGALDGLGDGYHPLNITISAGAARVEKSIAFALLRQSQPAQLGQTVEARKRRALSYACDHGEARMGRVLALLSDGRALDGAAREALEDTLQGIEDRRDCSDFVMIPLLWAYGSYAEDFPSDLCQRSREAILGYRYWMDEPGNDAMWFWSENHVLCFHVSAYLAGRLFPDEVFPNSGLTGSEHLARAERRMARWYDSVSAHGFAEWNSAAYYPIDFIGLFAMHHWATGAMKTRATALLDQLFTMVALHTCGGVAAGTMGRAYDKELRAGPCNELAPFAAVAFGKGWLNAGVAALPEFCLSDYAPPPDLTDLAAPPDGEAVEARYVQGHGTAARLALYKSAHVQLSASVDGAPGQAGHQQHLIDMQWAARPFERAWINHPGDDDPWGTKRPSYWAGNGVMPLVAMTGNRALLLSQLDAEEPLAWTQVYAPLQEFDAHESGRDWLVLRAGSGAVILKATGPIDFLQTGPAAGIGHLNPGQRTGWAVVAMDHSGPLHPLCARAQAMVLRLTDRGLILTDPDLPELGLDQTNGLTRDGQPCPFPATTTEPQIAWTHAKHHV